MKFVHTADWQIGMRAEQTGLAAEQVREERLRAAERVVVAATAARAEFIVVAGDTFEDNGVDRLLVRRAAQALARFKGPVLILPANHDPLMPGSVWEHPVWGEYANLRVLREASPVREMGGVSFFPCPIREKMGRADPTQWIASGRSSDENVGLKIGIAHGTVIGLDRNPTHPISRDAAHRGGLDYLAIGHWHSFAPYPDAWGAIRMAYCGTHETASFAERDSGHALLVEIDSPGAPPRIEQLRTGRLKWRTIDRVMRSMGDFNRLRGEIEALDEPENTLLRVKIAGLVGTNAVGELDRLREVVAARFLFGVVDTSNLTPMPEDQGWLTSLPAGIMREAAARLQRWSDPTFAGDRPVGAEPELARRALLELLLFSREGKVLTRNEQLPAREDGNPEFQQVSQVEDQGTAREGKS